MGKYDKDGTQYLTEAYDLACMEFLRYLNCLEDRVCECACHQNKLNMRPDQGYAHDSKCCDKMFGGVIPDVWPPNESKEPIH